jgi:hypothetical protein
MNELIVHERIVEKNNSSKIMKVNSENNKPKKEGYYWLAYDKHISISYLEKDQLQFKPWITHWLEVELPPILP